ncbi:MAG: glycosyltransferase [Gemmataceae bacterium]
MPEILKVTLASRRDLAERTQRIDKLLILTNFQGRVYRKSLNYSISDTVLWSGPLNDLTLITKLVQGLPHRSGKVLVINGDVSIASQIKSTHGHWQVISVNAEKKQGIPDTIYDLFDGNNITSETNHIQPNSLNAVIFGIRISQTVKYNQLLNRIHCLLAKDGIVLTAIENARHHSFLSCLAEGDFPLTADDEISYSSLPFTRSSAQRFFLNAGYSPDLFDVISDDIPSVKLQAFHALLGHNRAINAIDHIEYKAKTLFFRLHPFCKEVPQNQTSQLMLTFVVCLSNENILRSNLLASPDLAQGHKHEMIFIRNCSSAAEGLNMGLENAKNEIVICIHQDVFLPKGWCDRFSDCWFQAQSLYGPLGVVGVYGVVEQANNSIRAGHVIDRIRMLKEFFPLPVPCRTLDELLLAIPRNSLIRFDPNLGFHLYGADACLQAQRLGLANVIIETPCLHNSRTITLPNEFSASATAFSRKWQTELPVSTPCVKILRSGDFHEW